jgi:hypothetical protein
MTDDRTVLTLLGQSLDELPRTAPDRVLTNSMAAIGTTRQRNPLGASIRRLFEDRRALRVAMYATAAVTLFGLGAFTALTLLQSREDRNPAATPVPVLPTAAPPSAPVPTAAASAPVPTSAGKSGVADEFEVPFEYVVPPQLDRAVLPSRDGVAYIFRSSSMGDSVITVASATLAYTEACGGGMEAQVAPAPGEGFLDFVRRVVRIQIETTPAKVGDRSAVLASFAANPSCSDHVHFGDGSDGVRFELAAPFSRTYVAEVEQTTVVIRVQSADETDRVATLPANRIARADSCPRDFSADDR